MLLGKRNMKLRFRCDLRRRLLGSALLTRPAFDSGFMAVLTLMTMLDWLLTYQLPLSNGCHS